ncbi:MAG: Abi family protein [Erysipelotrichaceae bacterium]|nr:Abi family protein [Erysipelotrichaceae bacterium]
MKYKEPKTVKEQIEHLKTDKRIIFNDVSEHDAEHILEKCGYINVITPFKYVFAKKSGGIIVKENDKHVYEKDIEFKEYYDRYMQERNLYPDLYNAISRFETIFNAVVSQKVANYYSLNSEKAFDDFIQKLQLNLIISKYITVSAKNHMREEINSFKSKLLQYGSVFVFLDRLSLNSIITIYKTSDLRLKKEIFLTLGKLDSLLGYSDIPTFDDFLTRLVPIRNYVYHNNSLEVLYRYYSIEKNILRNDTDRKKYKNIVKKLVQTKKTA